MPRGDMHAARSTCQAPHALPLFPVALPLSALEKKDPVLSRPTRSPKEPFIYGSSESQVGMIGRVATIPPRAPRRTQSRLAGARCVLFTCCTYYNTSLASSGIGLG